MTTATTSATPRRRERAPLSSVDSNVIGSLRKKTKTSTDNTPPVSKQQKQFSSATTKTPGTKKKKKSKKHQKKGLVVNVDASSVVEFQLKQQQTVGDDDAQPVETLPNNVAAAHDASLSSVSLIEQHTPRYTFGSSGIFYDARQWEAQQSKAFQAWLNHLFHPTPEITIVSEEMRAAEMETAMILFNSRRMSAIRFAIDREVTEGRLAITPRAGRNILDEVFVQEQLSTLLLSYTPRWLQLGLHVVLAHHGDQRFHMPHDDMTKETLKKTILEQVLSKPSAIQKYTDGKVKTTNIFVEQMLRVETQQHTLSVLLILVYFLDEAKARHVLTEDPCLFEKTSNVKSSQEMLISLCQDCFAKQRSILNHLEYEGISVSHTQLPLDEYDFRVRNFAVDLKDGVCLAKMVELVTDGSNLLSFLRLPADTRQHKMYNVRLALAALRQIGVPHISDITSAHIVDAHQPRIIQLVWSTVLYLELPEFQEEILQYKASRLIQRQVRRHLAIKSYSMALRGFVSFQSLVRGATVRRRLAAMNVAASKIQKIWRGYDSKVSYGFKLMSVITLQSAVRQLLARKRVAKLTKQRNASIQIQKIWRGYERKLQYGFSLMDIISVQSVCRRFLAVRRLTRRRQALGKIQSLARVWKAKKMITRYQDAIVKIQTFMRKSLAAKYVAFLKRQEIEMGTTAKSDPHSLHLSDDEESDGDVFINYSTNQARRRDDKVSLIQHVEQVSECSIINNQSDEVGIEEEEDITSIVSNSSSVSDLDLASEIEHEVASVVIQMYWRRHVMSTKFITTKKAVIKCQSTCRRCIAKSKAHKLRVVRSRKLAAIKIAAFYRGKATRMKYIKMLTAVKTIQTIARGYFARKEVVNMKCFQVFLTWECSAKKIQAQYRRHLCSTMYKALITGVVSLQAQIRCIHAKKAYNEVLISRAHAATTIQKTFRSFYASSSFTVYKRIVNSAASTIQAAFRRRILLLKYISMKKAAILIQAKFRAMQAVHSFQLRLRSVHTLQRTGRKFLTELKVKELAATNIQRMWRGYTANVDFMLLVLAAIKIQAAARKRSAVIGYQNTLDGIILIQALYRSKSTRKLISFQQSSSIILQKMGRGFLSRLQRRKQLDAVSTIQRAVRKMIARTREDIEVSAAIEIQRVWRGFSTHVDYMLKVMAAMKIQSRYRESKAKRALLMLSIQHKSSIIIQQTGRGFLARMQKNNALSAAVAIQRAARKMMARKRDNDVRSIAAREIQRVWRGFSVHIDYMLTVMAAIRIQSAVRRFQAKTPLHRNTPAEIQLAGFSTDRDIIDSFGEIQAHPTPNHDLSPIMKWPESVIGFQAEPSKENTFSPPRVIDVTYTSKHKLQVNSTSSIPKTIMIESSDNASHKINVKNLSKYEKHTAKAIKVLRKSHLIHEIIEAVSTLEKTTSKSIDSCKLLLKARAHDNLLSLLGSCNRSSPHVELVRLILHILTNISRHQSILSMMVTRESSSSISDVIQMYRDKPDILALSTSLLESFVRSDAFTLLEYSSLEIRKCLHGVLALSQKRASARSRSCPDLDKGIASLKNVMHILEHGRPKPKPCCPYCNREF